jgi:hypothetical protein
MIFNRDKNNVSGPFYLFTMTIKRCPYCFSETGIRTILYGLTREEPDPAVYTIGGCVIFDDMPKFECIECGSNGFEPNQTTT